jgi:GcrA cell cycle regulator
MTWTSWPDEREQLLRALLAQPLSAGMIAQRINAHFGIAISRCAVIGKTGRLGLQLPNHQAAPRLVAHLPRHKARSSLFLPKSRPQAVQEQPGCSLQELTQQLCCWPIGDPRTAGFGYCGRARGHGRYCEQHDKLAYQRRRA